MSRKQPDHEVEIVIEPEPSVPGFIPNGRLVSVTIDGREFPAENVQDVTVQTNGIGEFHTVTIEHVPTVVHGAAVTVRKRDEK